MRGGVLVAEEQTRHYGQLVAGLGDLRRAPCWGRSRLAGEPAQSGGFVEPASAGQHFLACRREDLFQGAGGTGSVRLGSAHGHAGVPLSLCSAVAVSPVLFSNEGTACSMRALPSRQ